MVRPRSAPDAGVEETAAFLRDLRALRDRAGLRPGELAARAHFPEETLAAAESGPVLPSLPVLEAYVRACGASPAKWEDRWRRLTQGAVTAIGLPTRQPSVTEVPARIVPFPGAEDEAMAAIRAVSAEAMLAAAAEPSAVPPVAAPPAAAPPVASPPAAAPPVASPPVASPPAAVPPAATTASAPSAAVPRPALPVYPPAQSQPTVTIPDPSGCSWFEPATRATSDLQAAQPSAGQAPAAAPAARPDAGSHRARPEHGSPARTLTAVAIIVVVLAALAAAWLAMRG